MRAFACLSIRNAYKIDQVYNCGIRPLRVIPFRSYQIAPRDEVEEVSSFDKKLHKLYRKGKRYITLEKDKL